MNWPEWVRLEMNWPEWRVRLERLLALDPKEDLSGRWWPLADPEDRASYLKWVEGGRTGPEVPHPLERVHAHLSPEERAAEIARVEADGQHPFALWTCDELKQGLEAIRARRAELEEQRARLIARNGPPPRVEVK